MAGRHRLASTTVRHRRPCGHGSTANPASPSTPSMGAAGWTNPLKVDPVAPMSRLPARMYHRTHHRSSGKVRATTRSARRARGDEHRPPVRVAAHHAVEHDHVGGFECRGDADEVTDPARPRGRTPRPRRASSAAGASQFGGELDVDRRGGPSPQQLHLDGAGATTHLEHGGAVDAGLGYRSGQVAGSPTEPPVEVSTHRPPRPAGREHRWRTRRDRSSRASRASLRPVIGRKALVAHRSSRSR